MVMLMLLLSYPFPSSFSYPLNVLLPYMYRENAPHAPHAGLAVGAEAVVGGGDGGWRWLGGSGGRRKRWWGGDGVSRKYLLFFIEFLL